MKLTKIQIENLYAYHGQQTVDFSGTSKDRPIVLIQGRNGHGKTSLLNSILLLLVGSSHQLITKVGWRKRKLNPNQALVGADEWGYLGAFNVRARTESEMDFGVKGWFEDESSEEFTVERRWSLEAGRAKESLSVSYDGRIFDEDDSKLFIAERFPPVVVPFFLFDGEQIQEIAEQSDSQRAQDLELLLGLRHLIHFGEALTQISQDLGKQNLSEEVQAQLDHAETELKAVESEEVAKNLKLEELDDKRALISERQEIALRRLEAMARGAGKQDLESLDREIKRLEGEIDEHMGRFVERFIPILPVLAAPNLLATSIERVREVYEYHNVSLDRVVEEIMRDAPDHVFEKGAMPSPPLTARQKKFLKKKLNNYLRFAFGERDGSESPSWQLQSDLSSELYRSLTVMTGILPRERNEVVALLSKVSAFDNELLELQDKKLDVGSMTEAEKKQLEALREEIGECNGLLETNARERRDIEHGIKRLAEQKEIIEKGTIELQAQLEEAIAGDRKARYARRVESLFRDLRREKREEYRREIEKQLTNRFKEFASRRGLVRGLSLDEDFNIRAKGKGGRSIAMESLSHGIRQLVATAFVWSITEVSRFKLPLIIDTPLARIDRQNQENILTKYYPAAADQVILLATDSEIDERKFELIRDKIARHYEITNSDGASASLRKIKEGAVAA